MLLGESEVRKMDGEVELRSSVVMVTMVAVVATEAEDATLAKRVVAAATSASCSLSFSSRVPLVVVDGYISSTWLGSTLGVSGCCCSFAISVVVISSSSLSDFFSKVDAGLVFLVVAMLLFFFIVMGVLRFATRLPLLLPSDDVLIGTREGTLVLRDCRPCYKFIKRKERKNGLETNMLHSLWPPSLLLTIVSDFGPLLVPVSWEVAAAADRRRAVAVAAEERALDAIVAVLCLDAAVAADDLVLPLPGAAGRFF